MRHFTYLRKDKVKVHKKDLYIQRYPLLAVQLSSFVLMKPFLSAVSLYKAWQGSVRFCVSSFHLPCSSMDRLPVVT